MAGHSHWANIAHKKALIDKKRGKLWSKLSKAIIVAAKMGGGDADSNIRLRYAIDAAKAVSLPKDNIERAIKRGIGDLDANNLEEVLYEGYGPAGVAVLCEILTDNRNRTAGEIRKIFELADGKLGATGCVAWMFDRKGLFLVPADKVEEDALLGICAGTRRRRRQTGRRQVRDHLRSQYLRRPRRRAGGQRHPARAARDCPHSDFYGRSRRRQCPQGAGARWSGWTITTTCRASRRISTFPTRRWPRSRGDRKRREDRTCSPHRTTTRSQLF